MTSALELDRLIEEITVDCHDDDEQLAAFECAFEETDFPLSGTVVGEEVTVVAIDLARGRRELTAICHRRERRYEICLLDIELSADPPLSDLLAAYRRWIGI